MNLSDRQKVTKHREEHSSQTSMAPNLFACSLHHQDKRALKAYIRLYSKNKHTLLLSSDGPPQTSWKTILYSRKRYQSSSAGGIIIMIQDFGKDRKIRGRPKYLCFQTRFSRCLLYSFREDRKNEMFVTNAGNVNEWEYTKSNKRARGRRRTLQNPNSFNVNQQ